jgi:hypothetical protein
MACMGFWAPLATAELPKNGAGLSLCSQLAPCGWPFSRASGLGEGRLALESWLHTSPRVFIAMGLYFFWAFWYYNHIGPWARKWRWEAMPKNIRKFYKFEETIDYIDEFII